VCTLSVLNKYCAKCVTVGFGAEGAMHTACAWECKWIYAPCVKSDTCRCALWMPSSLLANKVTLFDDSSSLLPACLNHGQVSYSYARSHSINHSYKSIYGLLSCPVSVQALDHLLDVQLNWPCTCLLFLGKPACLPGNLFKWLLARSRKRNHQCPLIVLNQASCIHN